ncbi:C13 family peptidase [Variovorax rhizosphaerae]|uniref:C13 family peptidase n=1 Tax=Variovorax rhizosphaerae TaxID=1836200 RepID=A0ABU8WNG3_9BURK
MKEDASPDLPTTQSASLPPPNAPPLPGRASILAWIAEGLRSGLLLAPRMGDAVPTPWQLLVIVLLPNLLLLAVERFEITGPAVLNTPIALNYLWTIGALLWLGWWTLPGHATPGASARLPRWFALASWAGIPSSLLMVLLSIAFVHGWLPKALTGAKGFWIVYAVLMAWSVVAQVRLMGRFAASRVRLALFAPGLAVILGLGLWQALQGQTHVWEEDRSAAEDSGRARMHLSQELFEQQQAVWQRAVDGLAERQPGHANVYALVFAPYATEDVFLRESNMVTHLLEDRFDAKGRVLQLVNHATTTDTLPWATPLNLQRGIAALAGRMDLAQDVLVVYLTSHGASDHQLAASHWPLTVAWLTPEELRKALDDAGVKHRVVAISACFSGGWIDALASEDTLLMTAADATHTSYGCGRLSELTFFGRAMFDEELRKTHSFEKAFAAAVPVIQAREVEAGKDDGFSNPQIRVGERIRPVLEGLAERLDGGGRN